MSRVFRQLLKEQGHAPRLGYSIDEWCAGYGISRGTFYNMKKARTGPRTIQIGTRQIVTVEADQEFRRRRDDVGFFPIMRGGPRDAFVKALAGLCKPVSRRRQGALDGPLYQSR
jgi:hypothetical protein